MTFTNGILLAYHHDLVRIGTDVINVWIRVLRDTLERSMKPLVHAWRIACTVARILHLGKMLWGNRNSSFKNS